MRIGHTKTGFRVFVSKDEWELLTENGKATCAYVEVNNRSAMNFMTIGNAAGVPNGRKLTFIHQKGAASSTDWPELIQAQPKAFQVTKDMPYFSPETVHWEREEDVQGIRLRVARPPMQAAPNLGRKPRKAAVEPPRTLEATPLPATAEKTVALPSIPAVEREEIKATAVRASLQQAVEIVNQYKLMLGAGMELEVTPKGYLVAQMIFGGDPDA